MSTPDQHGNTSPAAPTDRAAGEITGPTPSHPFDAGGTIELATRELMAAEIAAANIEPDEVGPTVVGIPIRNQLAAARIAHVLTNAREAQALIDEAVELLATVRGLHAETYQLGATRGALRDTVDQLARHARAAQDESAPAPPDLKNDPSYEEIAIWISFGIPVTS